MKRYLLWFALVSGIIGMAAVAHADAAGSVNTVEKKEEKVRFGGFSFDFTMADSSGLNAVGQNYHNELNFYFEPTWSVGAKFLKGSRFKNLAIGGRFSLTQGLSGTDETGFGPHANSGIETPCYKGTPSVNGQTGDVPYCNPKANDRRADYGDVWLTIKNPKIYTIPKLDINVNPSLRFVIPASLESRYQTLQFAITPSLGVSRMFWKDRIRLGYSFGFTKNFHKYKTPTLDAQGNQVSASTAGQNPYDGVTGAGLSNIYSDPSRTGTIGGFNTSYSFLHYINGTVNFNDKWSFDMLYIVIDAFSYDHPCSESINGMVIDTCATGNAVAANSNTSVSRPGHKDTQVFWATINYQALDWMSVYLAWINWAPMQKPDTSYRQGIVSTDYNAYTTVSLGLDFSLDKLAGKIWKN